MSEQFKVGEVLIGQNFVRDTEYNGAEAVVLEPFEFGRLKRRHSKRIEECWRGRIRWANGVEEFQSSNNLRRRKPPAADSNEHTFMQKWRDMADKAPQRVGETV